MTAHPSPRPKFKLATPLAALMAAACLLLAPAASASDYVPHEVIVGYAPGVGAQLDAAAAQARVAATGAPAGTPVGPSSSLVRLPAGETVAEAIARLRRQPGVRYAVPDFVAHVDSVGGFIPDDPGRGGRAGWERLQWNFLAATGVDAPQAWANLIADHRPGGRGVVVAVLDTGVAYRNWQKFRRSPDFDRTRFVHPYDFIAHNRHPLDREGHGTFVAGTVAESTNNRVGLTGLAYGASIMPVRVLDATGAGDAGTIARGIRYAVDHGARVMNMSLEFTPDVSSRDIPDVMSAIRYAIRHRVVVVAASGNDGINQVAYPARAPGVISVGATTKDRCLADYSNGGGSLSLVAPGGGQDTTALSDAQCHPSRGLPPIYQMTFFTSAHPARFGLPSGIYGTSMASPHVAATAAMVIASGILGPRPSPARILTRLEQTATPLGGTVPNQNYGWGLLNAGAATAPITP